MDYNKNNHNKQPAVKIPHYDSISDSDSSEDILIPAAAGAPPDRKAPASPQNPQNNNNNPKKRESKKYVEEESDEPLFAPTFGGPNEIIQAPNIPFDSLVLSNKLGSGTFGTVYKGSCRGTVVAIKVLKVTSVNIEDILQEVGMMSHLRFQNIVTMHGVSFHDEHLYIVSEYLPCGDLEHWLADKEKEMSYITKLKILKDVAMGMNWLHSSDPPVIHRDLKPANVLLTTSRRPGDEETILREKRVKEIEKDLMAKVTDMGLSKLMTKQLKADGAGSNLWMAPELLKYQYYDAKVDVYSFALLIWQVLTWTRNPFQDYLDRGDLDVFVEAVYYNHVRPEIPKGTHPRLIELMDAGWAHLAKDRPEFSEIAMALDDCLITTLFKDEHYAIFWKKNWGARILHKERRVEPAKEVIPFNVFANALYDYLATYGVVKPENPESDVYYLCLKVMVIDPKEVNPAVTLERLLLIEKWFGPLVDENYKRSPRKSSRASNKVDPINLAKVVQLNDNFQTSPRKKQQLKKEPEKKTTPRSSAINSDKSPRKPSFTEDTKNIANNNKKILSPLPGTETVVVSELHLESGPKVVTTTSAAVGPETRPKPRSRHSRLSKEISSDERPEERTLLGTLKHILEQTWFHGDISKENADSSLATNRIQENSAMKLFGNQPQGDFLVRLSFSEPVEKHPFTITKVDKKGVIFHQRIFFDEDAHLYKVLTKHPTTPEISADSIVGLVKALIEVQLVHKPCKRWNYARKYDDIFQQKELHDKGYLDQGFFDNN